MLKQAVEDEIRAPGRAAAHRTHVIVRVYTNMKGLAKTYKDMEILPQATCFEDFVRGFNMGDPMCDYVDAGDGKECSDTKIKGKHYMQRCSIPALTVRSDVLARP